MLKIFVFKRHTLYIALALLAIIIIGAVVLIAISGSDETFSETMKYAYKKISTEQAKVLIEKNPELVIFDVRDEKQYLEGHIPNAQQISYKELKKKLDYFSRDSIYMIYGDDAKQSSKAADSMASSGFSKIYMLNGGMDSWTYSIE